MTLSECLVWIGAWHQASLLPLSEAHAETLRITQENANQQDHQSYHDCAATLFLASQLSKERSGFGANEAKTAASPLTKWCPILLCKEGQDWQANLIIPLPSSFQLKYSHGILLHPFAGRGIMLGPVLQVDLGNLWHQRIIGVRICQKR